jgi:hypothetical protein
MRKTIVTETNHFGTPSLINMDKLWSQVRSKLNLFSSFCHTIHTWECIGTSTNVKKWRKSKIFFVWENPQNLWQIKQSRTKLEKTGQGETHNRTYDKLNNKESRE